MVSRVKVTTMVLGAVVAFSVLGAASASAEWLVGGTVLSGSAALSPQALVDASSTFLVPSLGLAITCGGHFLDATDPLVIAPEKIYASSLKFLGCNTTKPATGCALEEKEQSISTAAVLARAFLGTGEEDRLLFAPETGSLFTSLKFSETNTCAFNGSEPIKGSFIVAAPTGRLNLSTQPISGLGSVENNSLEAGGIKVFLDGGRALLRLVSESAWSFM